MKHLNILEFIKESNKIENILREPTAEEIQEFTRFYYLETISIKELQAFVSVYQPNARLRDRTGLNVIVGNHTPPKGGMNIVYMLEEIIEFANAPPKYADRDVIWERAYNTHHKYETIHPFTDGNGRSGRMLWAWMMKIAPLGFLHTWYYQSLDAGQGRN